MFVRDKQWSWHSATTQALTDRHDIWLSESFGGGLYQLDVEEEEHQSAEFRSFSVLELLWNTETFVLPSSQSFLTVLVMLTSIANIFDFSSNKLNYDPTANQSRDPSLCYWSKLQRGNILSWVFLRLYLVEMRMNKTHTSHTLTLLTSVDPLI